MHSEAHGLMPNQVIEVDSGTVAQFLGRLTDPEPSLGKPNYDSAFRAIVFVDMVNSTDITRALGDSVALGLVQTYRKIVRSALVDHGGREVDRAGDGFLTSFESAYASVTCAIAMQREFSRANDVRGDGAKIQARIGIGAGEPVLDGDALFGSTVNLTSRICTCAEPGQIVAARVVRDLCLGKDVAFEPLGATMLKGFDDAIDLELVEWRRAAL
jgi:class 3 adenylate cyclase